MYNGFVTYKIKIYEKIINKKTKHVYFDVKVQHWDVYWMKF